MRREYTTKEAALEVLKEAVWLAWVAAGGPQGFGVLRDRPGANKDEVFNRAYNEGDYAFRSSQGQDLNADYVFGRMLKLRVKRPEENVLEVADYKPNPAYESWCWKYTTFAELFDAAEANIRVSVPL